MRSSSVTAPTGRGARSLLLTLRPLTDPDINVLLDRALTDERGLRTPGGGNFALDPDARATVVRLAGGDARRSLTYLEEAAASASGPLAEYYAVDVPEDATPASELRLLAIDIETTGLDPRSDTVLSIGYVPVDGDTIVLRNGQRVRLVQIDSPEKLFGLECYARESSDAAEGLLPEGTRVRLLVEPVPDWSVASGSLRGRISARIAPCSKRSTARRQTSRA